MCSAFVGSDSMVSIVRIVSLSSCRRTEVKKSINGSYLNNRVCLFVCVFAFACISLNLNLCITVMLEYVGFRLIGQGQRARLCCRLNIWLHILVILYFTLVFNWNHFEMRLLNLRINFYLLRTFCPHLGSFCVVSSFHYVSAKFHLWPSSGDLPRPWIGMMSLVTVSPVITAFHSCCLSHHVFDRVNLWPTWVGFETAIF